MEFLTDDDIQGQCTQEDLNLLAGLEEENEVNDTKDDAEAKTISYFIGYLSEYDSDKIFDRDYADNNGDKWRHALILNMVDFFLYTLYARQLDRYIPDIRVERYKDVLKWLQGIQKGMIVPGFPTVDTEDETDINNPMKWSSKKRVSGTW